MLHSKKLPLNADQPTCKARGPDQCMPQSGHPPLVTAGTVQPPGSYDLADDLPEGADEIAEFGGWSRRQVYHLAQTRRLSV
jgi:hypothetical protein